MPHPCTLANAYVLRSNKNAPLHLAAEVGNADIVDALLAAGASVLARNRCAYRAALLYDELSF
jgi:ankyrin repeat protein